MTDARIGRLYIGDSLAGTIPASGDPQSIDLDTTGIDGSASVPASVDFTPEAEIDLLAEGIVTSASVNSASFIPGVAEIDLDSSSIDAQPQMGVAPTITSEGFILSCGGIGTEETVPTPLYVDNETIYYDSRIDGWTGPFNELEPGINETYGWANDGSAHRYVASLASQVNSSISPGAYNALSIKSRRTQIGTGTYSQSGTQTVTVTVNGHGLSTGDRVSVVVTSGLLESRTVAGDVDSLGAITVLDANQFYFSHPDSGVSSGNCTVYLNESGALSSNVSDGADGTAIFPATNIEVEAKVRVDPRHGLRPSLSLRSNPNGVTSGEVDIFQGIFAESGDAAWKSSTHYLPGTAGSGSSNETSRTEYVSEGTEDDWHIVTAQIRQTDTNEAYITYFLDGVQQGPNSPTGYSWRIADNSTGWFADEWDIVINNTIGGTHVGDPAIVPYNGELWGPANGVPAPGAGQSDVSTWQLGEEPLFEVDYLLVKSITVDEPPVPEIRWQSECSGTDGASVAADDFNFTSGFFSGAGITNVETSFNPPDSVWLRHRVSSFSDAIHSFDFPNTHERVYGRYYLRLPVDAELDNDVQVLALRDSENNLIATLKQYINGFGNNPLYITNNGSDQAALIHGDTSVNTEYRIEWRHEYNATGDSLEIRIFNESEIVPLVTQTANLTSASPVARVDFGVSGLATFLSGDVLTSEHAIDTEDWIGPAGPFDQEIQLVNGIESQASVSAISIASEEVSLDLDGQGILTEASINSVSITPEEVFIDLTSEGIASEASVSIPPLVESTVNIELVGFDTSGSVSPISPLEPGEAFIDGSGVSILSGEEVPDPLVFAEEVSIDLVGIDDLGSSVAPIILEPGNVDIDLLGQGVISGASVSVISLGAGSVEINLASQGISSEASVSPVDELVQDDAFIHSAGDISSEASVSLVELTAGSVSIDLIGQGFDSSASLSAVTLESAASIIAVGVESQASVNAVVFETTAELEPSGIPSEASIGFVEFDLEDGSIDSIGGIESAASVSPIDNFLSEYEINLTGLGIESGASIGPMGALTPEEVLVSAQGIESTTSGVGTPTLETETHQTIDLLGVSNDFSASVGGAASLVPDVATVTVVSIDGQASVGLLELEPGEGFVDLTAEGITSAASVSLPARVDATTNTNVTSVASEEEVSLVTLEPGTADINLLGQGLDDTPVPSVNDIVEIFDPEAEQGLGNLGGITSEEIVSNLTIDLLTTPLQITSWGIGVVVTPYVEEVKDGVTISDVNQVLIADEDGNVIETTVYSD